MKILLTNHHFSYYGGSETAVLALFQSLTKKGHEVDVWSAVKSVGGIREQVNFVDEIKDHYDLALVNHNSCLKIVSELKCADKVIFTSHGPLGGLEAPIKGADIYCAVSEEVSQAYPEFEFRIARNGINLDRFKEVSSNDTLQKVLLLSNRTAKPGIDLIKSACEQVGAEFRHVGLNNNFTAKIENEIKEADIVVSVGRGAVEALAMGKRVLIWDHRPYNGKGMGDGMFTPQLGLKSMKFNYSGRALKRELKLEEIVGAFKNYQPQSARFFVERYHDIDKIADKYISLYKSLLNTKVADKKRILILAGLQHYHESYSLSGIIKTQPLMFLEQGHEVGLVVHKNIVRSEMLEETGVKLYKALDNPTNTVDNLKEIIPNYDIIITHDFAWIEYMEWLDKVCDELETIYPDKLFIHQIHSSPGNEGPCPEWKKGRVRDNVYYSHPGKELGPIVANHLQIPSSKVLQLEYTNGAIEKLGGDENLYHELDIIDQDFVGFYPAHPMPGKNIPAILHIVSEIKKLGRSIKYIFTVNGVPEGKTRVDGYKDLAKDLGIEDNIIWMYDIPRFRSQVEPDVIKKIWARTNLFIHPSLSEANPLILLEAMMSRCILVLNEDFERFKEMAGGRRSEAIYHSFGSHLKGNQVVNQESGPAKKAAEFIVRSAMDSYGFWSHNRIIKCYNRKNLYYQFMSALDNTQSETLVKSNKVSVVIPVLNVTPLENKVPELIKFTTDCIDSVGKDAQVIVVNNCPDDKNVYSDIQINNPFNYGVSRAWNQGVVRSTGDYIMILNSDVVLPHDWMVQMLKWADKGIVFPWSSPNQGEGEIPYDKAHFPHLQGSCFMAHKNIFRKIGPFDQERYFAYAEDQDYWKRAMENGVRFYRANCVITHALNATSSKITKPELLYNQEQLDIHGPVGTFKKIFIASNQAYEDWWGEKVKGV